MTNNHQITRMHNNKQIMKTMKRQTTAIYLMLAMGLCCAYVCQQLVQAQQQQSQPSPRPWRLRFQSQANRGQSNIAAANGLKPLAVPHATGSAVELPASSIVAPANAQAAPVSTISPSPVAAATNQRAPEPVLRQEPAPAVSVSTQNRTTRTADVFSNGDGFNMFVTNTCERETMRINVKTSRPFYGVIHTRDNRNKAGCSVEGNGASEYNLDISQTLVASDASYCGALRGARETPQDSEIVSLVVAVRVHKSIELSDDRFFLLNCTNRCRKPDCSTPTNSRLRNEETEGESEFAIANNSDNNNNNRTMDSDCTIYKFPWAVSLLWALGIMCIALIISHCFLCSSLVCRCVRKEVEEQEPSIYGDGSIVDYSNHNASKQMKESKSGKHPYRIEYDNRDIYKTSNNYDPYDLGNNDDDEDELEQRSRRRKHNHHHHHDTEAKRTHHKHSHR